MSITKYQIFLKTAACGSFSKAAEAMNFTQSGISHAINSLEAELGVTLLSRNRGGGRPGPAAPGGEALRRPPQHDADG